MNKVERKKSIDFALGMMFIGGSLAFSLVETEVFKRFVSLLDSSYVIPTRQTLSSTIVNNVRSKIEIIVKPEKPGLKGTLVIDGWKNSSNNTKTVTVVVKPENEDEIFLKAYNFSVISEDHLNLLDVVNDAIVLANQLYGINITSYVSDNASNMVKTGQESTLISYGCKAHVGNLYLNDVFDRDIFNEAHEMVVKFRNTALQQLIKGEGGKSIYLGNTTRWKVI